MIGYGSADKMWWDGRHMEVRFLATDQGRQITCRITWEWLTDTYGNGDDDRDAQALSVAQEHFDTITDLIGKRIAAGRLEPDGSVVLKSVG